MEHISVGDIIGYVLTFIVGFLGGAKYKSIRLNYNSQKVKQNNNNVSNGDIIGGNKIEKNN